MRHRPEINFSAAKRLPPRRVKTEGGYGIRLDCSSRDTQERDYDLGFHCHQLALKSCMKLWGLSQLNPLLGSYSYDEPLLDEYFNEVSYLAPNARRYIEIFDDRELADATVGRDKNQPIRFWDALGLIIHGHSFVAGYVEVPRPPELQEIHLLLLKSLEEPLNDDEQRRLEALQARAQSLSPMRKNLRLVGFTISSDKKEGFWVSIEAMAQVFLEQKFKSLAEWQRSAEDFRPSREE